MVKEEINKDTSGLHVDYRFVLLKWQLCSFGYVLF